jgi:hypothetical protein
VGCADVIPVWARSKLIRAAFLAGCIYQAGGTVDEVKRATDITLGESGAMPVVRDATKNRPIAGHRWADVSPWGLSLIHWLKVLLGASRAEQETLVRSLLDPRQSAPETLIRIRAGSAFHAEIAVRDGIGIDGRILREISDAVMAEVSKIDAAARTLPLAGVTIVD